MPVTNVTIAPTLDSMQRVYTLSRAGGPRSPRFAAYKALVENSWGLSSFNPMAGDAAATAVDALLALDAESVARNAAEEIVALCVWPGAITLAVIVASPGMWTDRLATEVHHRTVADRRDAHGEIQLWSGDTPTIDSIRTESRAEAVRSIWTSLHGAARSLDAVLAREGLAYALARPNSPVPHPDPRVADALAILGNTATLGDIVAVLYGDPAATALGHTPLGLAEKAGYEWAIARAADLVERVGAPQALRAPVKG